MSEKIPPVTVLTAFSPTDHGPDQPLGYKNLYPKITEQQPHESIRWDRFLDAEPGTVQELRYARHLANFMILQTAGKLNEIPAAEVDRRALWADRFTLLNQEYFAAYIDRDVWSSVAASEFTKSQGSSDAHKSLNAMYLALGVDVAAREAEVRANIQPPVEYGDYIKQKYSDVFALVDKDTYTPQEFVQLFRSAFSAIGAIEDGSWDKWNVELTDTDKLAVNGAKRIIKVGKHRPNSTREEAVGLLAHEALLHAVRAERSKKTNDRILANGLPNYITAEEGLGVAQEAAVTGIVPPKISQRYLDIGLALGVTGRIARRKDLLSLATFRNLASVPTLSQHDAEDKAAAQVNRIFRGTPADDETPLKPGVFTRDAAYYIGYRKICDYLHKCVDEGKDMATVYDFIMQGKFDPTDDTHLAYVKEKGLIPELE